MSNYTILYYLFSRQRPDTKRVGTATLIAGRNCVQRLNILGLFHPSVSYRTNHQKIQRGELQQKKSIV